VQSRTESVRAKSCGGEWHEFQGTWTGAGNRYSMPLGSDRCEMQRLYWSAEFFTAELFIGVSFVEKASVF
jgi:hypothetical protein